ncbi:MAG: carboxylating nicotinate-nucleotide diphosphorylase [Gammaproteobacteria bacterium]|jgi:nicotinate-nucleotide pyrophosphorylase (carboxylating)
MNDIALPPDIAHVVHAALAEDVGAGDVTAELIAPDTTGVADIICRESAVLSGTAWFDEVFRVLDPHCRIEWHKRDGEALEPGDCICTLSGTARALVTGERTALNFLQTLSGTATATRRYAAQLDGTGTTLLDTRKTLPGLRSAQKYAVVCGGGRNHRIGLFDAILIKENHIEAAGSITAAIGHMRKAHPELTLEIEVESLDDARTALDSGADMLLLDNFSLDDLRAAVALTAGRVKLEASGGFELDGLRAVAETGVDFISVGALTKHVRATDFSMRFRAAAA